MHQHLGALDLYVSFFLWRLVQFEYGQRVSAVLDFAQWHQKFFWDAIDCKALFKHQGGQDILGRLVYGTTHQPGRALVESICKNLIRLARGTLSCCASAPQIYIFFGVTGSIGGVCGTWSCSWRVWRGCLPR